ncbi:MAG: MFS transporter [Archaeoglobus sp.]|nr:MFS transporter [Archaeoglobus sp.]
MGRELLYVGILGTLFGVTAFDTLLLGFAVPDLIRRYALSHSEAGLLGTGLMIGVALGAISLGAFSDIVGRRKVIFLSVVTFSISTGIMAMAGSYLLILLLLFVSGFGLGGGLTMAIASLPDVIESNLDKYMCYMESFWGLGALLVVSVFYFKINLNQLFLAGFLPILTLPIFHSLPDVRLGKDKSRSIIRNVGTLLRNYKKLTILLWIIWFCGIYTYYGVFLWLPDVVSAKFEVPVLIPVYGIQIVSPLLLSFFAREQNTEKLLAAYSLFAAIATLVFVFSASSLMFAAMLVLSFFSIGGWVLLILSTQKSYPMDIRGLGVGAAASVGRVGGILAPWLTGYLMDLFGNYIVAFVLFAALFLLIAFTALPVSKIRYGLAKIDSA